jgi:hypothetical protein
MSLRVMDDKIEKLLDKISREFFRLERETEIWEMLEEVAREFHDRRLMYTQTWIIISMVNESRWSKKHQSEDLRTFSASSKASACNIIQITVI